MAAPNPEKQPIPPQGEQYFPPPPPGPPPAQSKQEYYPPPPPGAPSTQAAYGQPAAAPQQHGQQQHAPTHSNEYPIPEYNPANPQFAPPPVSEPTTSSTAEKPPPSPSDPAKKQGWSERLSAMGMKAADPINALAHKLGSQSFLPTTLDKECEKAAVILRQFCKEGVTTEGDYPGSTTDATGATPATTDPAADEKTKHGKHEKPKKTQKAIVTIPAKVIAKAQGLAIFTTARIGFHISGATGSGVVIARLPDGSWGPPSGIQVLSVGAGFLIGADIYDCVCVINNKEALQAFTNNRVSLGTDLAVAAGPYGAGGALDVGRATASEKPDGTDRHGNPTSAAAAAATTTGTAPATPGVTPAVGTATGSTPEVVDDGRLKTDKKSHRRGSSASLTKPVFYYVKSRGLYAGVAVDGTAINERREANAAFYGAPVSVEKILRGEVPPVASAAGQASIRTLHEALRAAETGKRASYNASSAPGLAGQASAQAGGYQQQAAPYQQTAQQPVAHDNKPGFVSVPVQRQENPVGNFGPQLHHGPGGAPPSFPPPPGGEAAGADSGAPPGYVDDGKAHGTGDLKTTYQ